MICDTRTTSVFKLKPIWAQISRSDWCLGASRCGGNALSRDGLLRSTPGWWGQQYHGDPWCIFWYESHICPFVTIRETMRFRRMLCEVTTPEKWDGISRHWQHRAWWPQGNPTQVGKVASQVSLQDSLCFSNGYHTKYSHFQPQP